jgi:phosphoglycerate dehydrogenase-like enzyme
MAAPARGGPGHGDRSPPLRVAAVSPSFCEHPVLCAELKQKFPDAKFNTGLKRLAGADLIAFLQGYDVAMVGLEQMTAEVIDALPDLKIITKLGTGIDMIDAEAMIRHNIRLGWKAGANALSIAELVIAFALLALRGMGSSNLALRNGGDVRQRMGRLLSGRVFGLHGCGHIGQAVVRLLKPFECKVIACDVMDRSAFYAEHGVEAVSFEALLARSEVLSIHVPLTPETEGLYGAAVLDRLRSDCVLINTARGQIVDEDALYDRLVAGALHAACADVFAAEPSFESRLIALPNFFGTPHIGGSATEARLAMGRIAIDGIFNNFVPVVGTYPFI